MIVCARRSSCGSAFGQGFNSPRLHQMQQRRTPVLVVRLCPFIGKKVAPLLVLYTSMVDLQYLYGCKTRACCKIRKMNKTAPKGPLVQRGLAAARLTGGLSRIKRC